jgi:hypothetical protein
MKVFIEQSELSRKAHLQPNLDELVHVANQWPINVSFHLRNLVEEDELWRAWYSYWHERDISKVLILGREFYRHPDLKAKYIGKDPNPKDGAAMYINR